MLLSCVQGSAVSLGWYRIRHIACCTAAVSFRLPSTHSSAPEEHQKAAMTTQAAPSMGALGLAKELAGAGVSIVFANPGTSEMGILAGLDGISGKHSSHSAGGIRPVLGLHETVCTGAADGYARMIQPTPGKPGLPAVLLHLGPGLANGISNLHNARRARSRVLCLVGQMASFHIGADPPLNMDISSLASTVSGAVISYSPPKKSSTKGGTLFGTTGSRTADQDSLWGAAIRAALKCAAASTNEIQPFLTKGRFWRVKPGTRDSHVVTLLVPHDLTWELEGPMGDLSLRGIAAEPAGPEQSTHKASAGEGTAKTASSSRPPGVAELDVEDVGDYDGEEDDDEDQDEEEEELDDEDEDDEDLLPPVAEQFVKDCAAALKACPPGKAAIYLGGEALLDASTAAGGDKEGTPSGLYAAGVVAALTGSILYCENAFARIDRGAGRPMIRRLPYFPEDARRELDQFDLLITADASLPVAHFGYKNGLSSLVPERLVEKDQVWEIDCGGKRGRAAAALRLLAQELGAGKPEVVPGVNCKGAFAGPWRPDIPAADGKLTAAHMCAVVAALLPESAVVVDESLTSSSAFWDLSRGCPPFSHLTLTGGAIGSGPPMALGAALACPGRRVINLQADGSAMYSLQALWSQAREKCDITTIIASNHAYNILKIECAKQRLPAPGPVTRALTDLSSPPLDWVALASGMGVPGVKVTTAGELEAALKKSFATPGPMLIQAELP